MTPMFTNQTHSKVLTKSICSKHFKPYYSSNHYLPLQKNRSMRERFTSLSFLPRNDWSYLTLMRHLFIAWEQKKNVLVNKSIDGLNFSFLEKIKLLLESTLDLMLLNALNDFQSCINLLYSQHQIPSMQTLSLI